MFFNFHWGEGQIGWTVYSGGEEVENEDESQDALILEELFASLPLEPM